MNNRPLFAISKNLGSHYNLYKTVGSIGPKLVKRSQLCKAINTRPLIVISEVHHQRNISKQFQVIIGNNNRGHNVSFQASETQQEIWQNGSHVHGFWVSWIVGLMGLNMDRLQTPRVVQGCPIRWLDLIPHQVGPVVPQPILTKLHFDDLELEKSNSHSNFLLIFV